MRCFEWCVNEIDQFLKEAGDLGPLEHERFGQAPSKAATDRAIRINGIKAVSGQVARELLAQPLGVDLGVLDHSIVHSKHNERLLSARPRNPCLPPESKQFELVRCVEPPKAKLWMSGRVSAGKSHNLRAHFMLDAPINKHTALREVGRGNLLV